IARPNHNPLTFDVVDTRGDSKRSSVDLGIDTNQVSDLAAERDQLAVVTLSSLSQSTLPGHDFESGFYAANSALIMREDAVVILSKAIEKGAGRGFIGTNRLHPTPGNRKLFCSRLKE